MTIALFPGQGVQAAGMDEGLHERASDVFALASEVLGVDVSELCRTGRSGEADLTSTRWAQPAVLVCSVASFRSLGRTLRESFDALAGHSIGEYAALTSAGALDLADAVRLVALRARVTEEAGLATPGGTISSTGIAGFTLGGGLGFLAKKFGLACDNLIDAEVVLASGDVVRANERENTDLFWAIRGGGGNFGLVSSFTFQAHPVTDVTFAMFMWPAAEGLDHLKFYRDYFPDTPPEVVALGAFATAPPLPFVPEHIQGTEILLMGVIYIGPQDEAEPWVKPVSDRAPAASAVIPMPYMFAQQLLDSSAPEGVRNYWRSAFMDTAPDGALEVMAEAGPKKGSHLSMIQLINVGPSPEVDNAFQGREHTFLYHLISAWEDPADDEQNIGWNTKLAQDLAPFSSKGAYLNFIGDEGSTRVRNTFGPKYDRLVELKRKFDPNNMFRYNQNIAP